MKRQSTLFQKIFSLALGMIFVLGIGVSSANCRTFDQFEKALESPYGLSLLDCHTVDAPADEDGEQDKEPDFCSFCKINQGFATHFTPKISFTTFQGYEAPRFTNHVQITIGLPRASGRAPPLS